MQGRSRKSKLLIGIVLIVIGVALLGWALMGRKADAPASEPATNNTATAQTEAENTDEPAATATISFTNDGFSPQELEVKVGTVVTVRNDSNTRVQFSSDDHPTHTINQGMNLPVLNPGESDTFTADEVGEWGFHDHLDDSHTGVLVVVE